MRNIKNRVVLVTGASTGIGLALARQLQRSNFRTVITARKSSLVRFSKEGLTEADNFLIRPLNVTDFESQKPVIDEIEAAWGGVDVLVNNAGISFRSVVEHMTPEDEMEQLRVNYFGPMHLTRLVLPSMRKKRRGHIINVSSVGGMMAMPTMGSYSASKFALEGASEALWYEMRSWGINVSLVAPGFIHSNSFTNVRFTERSHDALSNQSSPYYYYYQHMSRMIAKMMNGAWATPDNIAARIIKVMNQDKPPLRIPATIDAWVFHILRRILPRYVYHHLLYRCLPHIQKWVDDDKNKL